jgi:hypothetical protein
MTDPMAWETILVPWLSARFRGVFDFIRYNVVVIQIGNLCAGASVEAGVLVYEALIR